MSGRLSTIARSTSGRLWGPVLAAVLCAGCGGVPLLGVNGDGDRIDQALPDAMDSGMTPDVMLPVDRALPGLIKSIHANGVVVLGYAANVQGGDFSDYDAGEGSMFGMAFGNGEDIKRFVELIFVETKHHEYRDGSGGLSGDATHTQLYLGARTYLLPVTGTRSRAAPYFVGGLVLNDFDDEIAGGTESPELDSATGMGLYIGTGVEFYLGTQLALCLDVRASFWNWEGIPIDTGGQSTGGNSVSLVYHF